MTMVPRSFRPNSLLVPLLVINGALLAVIFLIPFNSDLDLYHAMGLELVRGRLPYVGSWDHNFPAIVFVHALSIALFGKGYIGFRILDLAAHLGIALVLYKIALRYASPLFAAAGATLNTLYYVGGSFWLAGQKDGFAVLTIGLAVLFYFRSKDRSARWMFFSGIMMGLTTAFRPTYGLFSISIALLAWFDRQDRNAFLSFIAGHVAFWALVLLPYTFTPNGLSRFYYSTIVFNLEVYGGARAPYRVLGLLRHPMVLAALPALLPFSEWFRRRWPEAYRRVPGSERWFGFFALASAWLSIYVMGKYLVYHFDPFMAVVAVFAARGIEKLYYIFPLRTVRVLAMGAIAAFLVRTFYPFDLLHTLRSVLRTHERPVLESVWRRVKNDSLFGLRAEEEATRYLESHTQANDKIEVCTIMPALRWRVDREEASPFTIAHPYAMHLTGHPFIPFQDSCRAAFAAALSTAKPKYVLLANDPYGMELFSLRSPAEAVMDIPAVKQILDADYRLDTTIGPYLYFKRIDVTHIAP